MNNRIRAVRKAAGVTQDEFSKRLNISRQYVACIETGDKIPSDRTIKDICEKFGVNETWLRTGEGSMTPEKSRAQEIAELTRSLMADRPESFRSAMVTALLRFDPNGQEWEILEDIYNGIANEISNNSGK